MQTSGLHEKIDTTMKHKRKHFGLTAAAVVAAAFMTTMSAAGNKEITQGEIWPDTDGRHINAHGGCVLHHDGRYYWYGEHRADRSSGARIQEGVTCYSSDDLVKWKPEGMALQVPDCDSCDFTRGCTIERPKVIYNDSTGKFVMWFHLELKGRGYEAARCASAVSETPVGPFTFMGSGRVNPGCYPVDMPQELRDTEWDCSAYEWWTPEWRDAVERGMLMKRDLDGGQMSRDMTLFVDDDGKAYHIYSSEENLTLNIAELTDDYLSHNGRYVRVAPGGHNEAPAIFKRDGRYWMVTSGCTGWAPNEARLMTADSIFGPWTQLPNPCAGPQAELTFGGQSTYVFPVQGKKDAYVAMFDRWRPENLADSRYVWLPVEFKEDGVPALNWRESWSPETFWE